MSRDGRRQPAARSTAAIASKEFSGKLFETFVTPIVDAGIAARRLAASALALQSDFTVDRARRAAAAIGLTARQKKIGRDSVSCARSARDTPEMIQAIAEGLTLARVRARALQDGRLRSVRAAGAQHHRRGARAHDGSDSVRRTAAESSAEHCNIARQLDNEPGNALTPLGLCRAARPKSRARQALTVSVLDAR